jgi:hypothetical protein
MLAHRLKIAAECVGHFVRSASQSVSQPVSRQSTRLTVVDIIEGISLQIWNEAKTMRFSMEIRRQRSPLNGFSVLDNLSDEVYF